MTTSDWLPGAIVGAITGVGGSTITAWIQRPSAHAAVEKTRDNRTHHRNVIENGRRLVTAARSSEVEVWNDKAYLDLRPHLSPETRQEVEHHGRAADYNVLLDDLDQLEKKWGLAG